MSPFADRSPGVSYRAKLNILDKPSIKGTPMSEAIWIAATMRLPNDGETVLVKTANGRVEHRVTFRAEPEPRWESRHFITEVELYAYWRPLPAERRQPAGEVRASG
jgi:hypothetical protein